MRVSYEGTSGQRCEHYVIGGSVSSDIGNPILGLSTHGRSANDDHHFPAGLAGLHDAMRFVDLLEAKHA